jgi:predicted ester cyclase
MPKMDNLNKIDKALRNKSNYLKAKEAFNNNRIDECILFYAPNHEVKSKQSEKGREGIRQFLEAMHQTWSDIQITVEHTVAEDNWVMGRSVATATHSQVVLGVQPTHKKITATFWDLHLFDEDGLIIETWNLMDNLAIMQQIGLLK